MTSKLECLQDRILCYICKWSESLTNGNEQYETPDGYKLCKNHYDDFCRSGYDNYPDFLTFRGGSN